MRQRSGGGGVVHAAGGSRAGGWLGSRRLARRPQRRSSAGGGQGGPSFAAHRAFSGAAGGPRAHGKRRGRARIFSSKRRGRPRIFPRNGAFSGAGTPAGMRWGAYASASRWGGVVYAATGTREGGWLGSSSTRTAAWTSRGGRLRQRGRADAGHPAAGGSREGGWLGRHPAAAELARVAGRGVVLLAPRLGK